MGRKKTPLLKKKKHPKHDKIVNDFENQKKKHLERLATKMLKDEEKTNKLKSKTIKGDFLDKF
jgi:hypothetical protein